MEADEKNSKELKRRTRKKKSPIKEEPLADPQENIIATNSIKKSTKATFDLYLEQAQANIARDRKASSPKKGKSKKQKEGEEVLLENLRNSSEFQKDTDEETKKRNTYNPDDSKEKSNKRRDRQRRTATKGSSGSRPPRPQRGHDNTAYESENANRVASSDEGPMTIEDLAGDSKKKQSKPKKTKRMSKNKPIGDDDAEVEETTFIEERENLLPEEEKKPSKKKKKDKVSSEETVPVDEPPLVEYVPYTDESKIAGVIVHRADKLRTKLLLQHPVVRVHIIDESTGQHLLKQDKDRPVTSFYETKSRDETPDTILPMMTQTFDFKEMRTVIPWWDEMLVFNENFNYLVQEEPRAMLFFEVLDFVSMNRASRNQSNQRGIKGEEGWHKEAWAFLKLRGANGKLNVDKQLRLQLFEVPRSRMISEEVPVYQYWRYCVRRSYPSSLYITIRSLLPPEVVEPAVRSMFPTQEERGTMTLKQIQETLSKSHAKHRIQRSTIKKKLPFQQDSTDDVPSNWSKLPGQMCKLPNSPMLNLPAGKMGCLVMRFSHDGRYLACACHHKSSNPILVYEIPSGELEATLSGHYNNVYEMCWSRADKYLLSASSDGTARVWDIDTQKCLKMLPHPTFVYCAKFHPRVSKVIVTGSYDNILRVWHIEGPDLQADLQQDLEGHDSYINSICFDEEGTKLFTADNGGVIKIWNVYVTEKATKKGVTRDWKLHSTIENEEIKDQSISYISLHPNGRRLLVQTKDNSIRMLDLRMMSITQRYVGALNFREIVHSDITVCGTFVFSGSEDGCVYVWNTETGDQVAVYSDLSYSQTVNDVKFHPLDHIVAFSSRGDNHKVQVFKYESNWADKDAKSHYTLVSKSQHVMDRATSLPTDDENPSQPREEMSLQIEAKKHRAMRKLETVMDSNKSLAGTQAHRIAGDDVMPSTAVSGGVEMTGTWGSDWGSTFDRSYSRTAASSLGPTIMSPHARQTGDTEAMRNHLTSQMEYMRKSPTPGWRPGFSPIASRSERLPAMSISMPSQSNPTGNFTLQGADEMKPVGEVVALYDYLAQRSDELSFRRNDVITIYYKDTEQWWMGMLRTTGAQGFVPSNYVENLDRGDKQGYSKTEDLNSPAKRTTALIDNGQLKFFSGTESDASSGDNLEASTKRKRRSRGTGGERRSRSQDRRKNRVSDLSSHVPSFEHLLE